MFWAMLAMLLMIVALDQLLWRPVVVWSQKFRVEEGGDQTVMSSWFLNWLRRSRIILAPFDCINGSPRLFRGKETMSAAVRRPTAARATAAPTSRWGSVASIIAFAILLAVLAYGGWKLVQLLRQVPLDQWGDTLVAGVLTLSRVLVVHRDRHLWALPAGLAIGLSPRLSRIFQPIVQVAASFPAPMFFRW